ncbi:Zn(II)2Cys6 transcription factor domain-containing protein [Aspergillus puulaauensis]|uniref:Zn(2)-C6 fungal-type domain-containing protein n=1 Tax=Aspergillus puulaauensis TaxID=1220207 RepID=A0A7R7XDI9_9EURO|nr:uncharacterized protein APUU_12260A [Aspergillus puulaauensis]BCS19432.1 hypothetical protein APUU_12260A [Aspergillus puulaauensis]
MSLRRKSCNACFKGRRKCNLAYPICDICRKTKKVCQYAYPPITEPSDDHSTASDSSIAQLAMPDDTLEALMGAVDTSLGYLESGDIAGLFELSPQFPQPGSASGLMMPESPPSLLGGIGRFLGSLGEVQPIQGSTQSWQWMIDELKHFPPEFAQRAETIFIHRDLYRDAMPQPIRTALGVSSMSRMLSDANRDVFFRIIDAEFLELLQPTNPAPLLDELARLQALVIHQTLRLFHGDIAQRIVAEQQQGILLASALKLLGRSQPEPSETSRDSWILAECIRRTAIIVYMLYGVNSIFRDGVCVGLHTLVKLPISTTLTRWDSEGDQDPGSGSAIAYEDFFARWLVSTPRHLDRFEKLLLVPCQGLDSVNAYTGAV